MTTDETIWNLKSLCHIPLFLLCFEEMQPRVDGLLPQFMANNLKGLMNFNAPKARKTSCSKSQKNPKKISKT